MLVFRRYCSKFCPKLYLNQMKENYIEMPKIMSMYSDKIISKYVKSLLPEKYFKNINDDLDRFSLKMENEYFNLHQECEHEQPKLQKYDSWGKCVDKLITCNGWKRLKSISSEEGLVAIPYERHYKEYSRVYQGVKLFLFASLSGLYGCPLAMTDGAAYVIEALGKPKGTNLAFDKLVSRNPENFWTSGQWMTEKDGGSDVANSTQTVAMWDKEKQCHRLYGYKWFSSATDANMALTLARSLDLNGKIIKAGGGLSLYYVETKSQDSESQNDWNHLELVTLKDKLGTRQLPTAELILNGSEAVKLSEDGRGISTIAGMLTITRIHNAISAVSAMRRIVLLATEYAKRRECFGSFIIDKPLHAFTLAGLDVESRAAFYFVMDVMRLLGLQENKLASTEDIVTLRILSPLLKLYTAKQAMSVISEGLECFGGQGYIETTGLPGMLRDAQVLPIWEGTTNVLSLDLLRSLKLIALNDNEHLKIFIQRCKDKLTKCDRKRYSEPIGVFDKALFTVESFLSNNKMDAELLQLQSRSIAFSLSRIYMGILLLEQSSVNDYSLSDHLSVLYWTKKDLVCGLDGLNGDLKPDDWVQFFH